MEWIILLDRRDWSPLDSLLNEKDEPSLRLIGYWINLPLTDSSNGVRYRDFLSTYKSLPIPDSTIALHSLSRTLPFSGERGSIWNFFWFQQTGNHSRIRFFLLVSPMLQRPCVGKAMKSGYWIWLFQNLPFKTSPGWLQKNLLKSSPFPFGIWTTLPIP